MRNINTAALRDASEDDQVPCFTVTVKKHEGDAAHWRVNEDNDLVISVVTHRHEVPIEALIGGIGALGRGVVFIPDEGTEGVVVFDHGDFEGDCTFFPRGSRGGNVVGLGPGKVHVIGLEVLVHDGAGGAEALVRKSEHDGHTHPAPALSTGSYGVGSDPVVRTGGAPAVTGTSVLKAK